LEPRGEWPLPARKEGEDGRDEEKNNIKKKKLPKGSRLQRRSKREGGATKIVKLTLHLPELV
jgi:hypothetical protein